MPEHEALEKAIAALEAQRSVLGDAVVDAVIAALRQQFAGAPPSPQKERRQVTILFADLVGFTALAERMDPEEVHEVLEAYFDRWKAAIARHGGMVEKFIGDAVVAVFGLPSAREDAAAQALRTALQMGEELQDLNRRLEKERGLHLAMRVGIHSGPVLAHYAGKTSFTVTGDAVNLAARLEQAAPPGGILISQETFEQVRGLFEVTPQEPFPIKGKTKPVQTYLVHGLRPESLWPAGRGLEGLETPMVGRERELAALQEAFQAVIPGESRFLIVVGEAGIGKTRLLREFERLLENRALRILRAHAVPESLTFPYALLRDLFCRHFGILESDAATTACDKFVRGMSPFLEGEQALLVGQLVGFDFASAPSVRNLLGSPSFSRLALANLTHFFRTLATSSPTLILLEDLHWADNSSLEFFSHLPVELPSLPLLIAASARPDLLERCPDLFSEGGGRGVLHLRPLSLHDCHTLAEEILRRVEGLPPYLPDLLAQRSGGNPFFLEELVHMLIAKGVIVPWGDRWRIFPERFQERRVPPTLTALLEARLDALPPAEKVLLQRASVVGQRFWDGMLVVLGGEEADPVPLLEDLEVRGMVVREERSAFSGAREYAFRHVLLQEVCYETVLLRERRVYHRRVAEWLEEQAGERRGEYAGRIGEHYERAGEGERAAYWLHQAGEVALQRGAFAEAAFDFERALALLPDFPQEEMAGQRVTLLTCRGIAQERLGNYAEAERWLRDGLNLAREIGLEGAAAEALGELGLVAMCRGDYDEARRLSEEALVLAQKAADSPAMARALRRVATAAYYQGDFPVARQYLEKSLSLEEKSGNLWGAAACLNNLGPIYSVQGDYVSAIQCYERSLALHREIGDRLGTSICLNNLGWIALQQGEYAQAVRYNEESLALLREVGDWPGVANCLNNLGHAMASLGREEEAWRYYREALESTDAPPIVLEAVAGLAGVLARAGQHRRAAELLGLALYHPASCPDVAKAAEPALSFLRAHMSAEALEMTLEQGKFLDLEDTVRALPTQVPPAAP